MRMLQMGIRMSQPKVDQTEAKMVNSAMKPIMPGRPRLARDRAAVRPVRAGMRGATPPSLLMLRVPVECCSDPAAMNIPAEMMPWATFMKAAPAHPSSWKVTNAMVIMPMCETEEYAIIIALFPFHELGWAG